MSNAVFPVLQGLGWDVTRTPIWDTTVMQAISGKETRIAKQTFPRWQWDLTFDVLRQGTINQQAYNEFSTLAGFFNARQGMFDSFLYTDADDNTVTTQTIGTGDGTTTAFQLVRAFGGFTEPVLAPNLGTGVPFQPYIAGVAQGGGTFAVNLWGQASPGVITFNSAPANGAAVTCTFTYFWPCRFLADKISFNKFMQYLWAGKRLSFISVKN